MREQLESALTELGGRGHRALVAGVVRDGEVVWAGWSADADVPDQHSRFEIGSITKVLTGVLLADMAVRGEVALEDPLSRHLPEPRPAWRGREPTLLELATHRSGLPNVPGPLARRELAYALGWGDRDPWSALTRSDHERLVARESPRRRPGGGLRYSSLGVGLLGDALAARTGQPYGELLAHRVLQPLGMTATTVGVGSNAAPLVAGHSRRGRLRPPLADFIAPAGGVRSSVADMARFLGACLDPSDTPLGGALALAQEPRFRVSRRLAVGLCWMIAEPRRHARVVWHNGGTWGFRSFAAFAPERGIAAVVMSNTARGVEPLGFRLVAEPAVTRRRRRPATRLAGEAARKR